MVQSPSWEANWFAASQEIPRISWNPKVHYRTQKHTPSVPILGQPNPVHIPTSYLLEIHPNIIHPSTPRSPQWSLSIRFPHQDPIRPPLLPHTRHMLLYWILQAIVTQRLYNIVWSPSYIRCVIDRNVGMRRICVVCCHCYLVCFYTCLQVLLWMSVFI